MVCSGLKGRIVAEYGDDDDEEEEDEVNEKFADLKLMACLLCKRQFNDREGLTRHMQFSDLHKVQRQERFPHYKN